MISRFWDALFEYGDLLREQGREDDRKVLEEVYTILQTVYDKGTSAQIVIKDKIPQTDLEAFVLSIKDITVYLDRQDNSFYYELDNQHFDSPEEVMNYLLECRTKLQHKAMYKVRKEMIDAIICKIDAVEVPKVVGRTTPKTVQKSPVAEKVTASYLKEELEKGKTYEQIAIMAGCSKGTVARLAIKYGLNKRRRK